MLFDGHIKILGKVCFHLFAAFVLNVCLLSLHRVSQILVKMVPKQTPQQWLPVAVITSVGKYVHSEELIQGNTAVGELVYWN